MSKSINMTDEQVTFLATSLEAFIVNTVSVFGTFSQFELVFDLFKKVDPLRAEIVFERLQTIEGAVESIEAIIRKENEEINKYLRQIGRSEEAREPKKRRKLEVIKGGKN